MSLVVRHGRVLRRRRRRCGAALEVECVRQIEAEDRHAVEHRQAEQGHASARREHVRVLTSGNDTNKKALNAMCSLSLLEIRYLYTM